MQDEVDIRAVLPFIVAKYGISPSNFFRGLENVVRKFVAAFSLLREYLYRVADKSLARPGRKQTDVSVRRAWISFGALPCRKKKT